MATHWIDYYVGGFTVFQKYDPTLGRYLHFLSFDVNAKLNPGGLAGGDPADVIIPRTTFFLQALDDSLDHLGITYAMVIRVAREFCYEQLRAAYPLDVTDWPGEGNTGHSSSTNTLLPPATPYETISITI